MAPVAAPDWMKAFFSQAVHENEVLLVNGATQAFAARKALLEQLAGRVMEWCETEVDVRTAAQLSGVCDETIRRRIRAGKLNGEPKTGRGRHRIKRGQLLKVDQVGSKGYDPIADAQNIAQLRRRK